MVQDTRASSSQPALEDEPAPLWKLILVAAIAAGVQFGWALQLSLLTPYIQLLGVPHTWAAYIWLCGPVSGIVVQPIVGYYSDRCKSSLGRRRPFIGTGAASVIAAVILIGFAADIGHAAGDNPDAKVKVRACTIFIVGFWVLDVANNMLQGPCRALLADLCDGDTRRMRSCNAFFSFFMAVGNVLGYAAGSYTNLYKIFSFSKTNACDVYCANLKSCFIIAIILLLTITIIALAVVKEKPWSPSADEASTSGSGEVPFFGELASAIKHLSKPMILLLLVTCLNWISWFPFLLYDTDWMGKEVYGGEVGDGTLYDEGVRAGSLGLMLNSVVLGLTSLAVEFLVRGVSAVKIVWGCVNFIMCLSFIMTIVVSKFAEAQRRSGPDGQVLPPSTEIKASALAVFSVLGIPLSITYSIPFALASIYSSSSGAGQGLSLGVLNLAICFPQIFVSLTSGPIDALFGGGNLPMFGVAAITALISGVMAITMLPKPASSAKLTIAPSFH